MAKRDKHFDDGGIDAKTQTADCLCVFEAIPKITEILEIIKSSANKEYPMEHINIP